MTNDNSTIYTNDRGTVFEVIGEPGPHFSFEKNGDDPVSHYRWLWNDRQDIGAEEFDAVSDAQVKIAGAGAFMPDELDDEVSNAIGAIADLLHAMCEARDLTEEQTRNVVMGNLGSLPEVEKVDSEP